MAIRPVHYISKVRLANIIMPENTVLHNSQYEIIDTDPHFYRVVDYFRPSDWVKVGLFTVSGPAFLAACNWGSSGGKKLHLSGRMLRIGGALGFVAGFLNSYAASSLRFAGGSENAREVQKDRFEIKKRLSEGKPAWGEDESKLPDWLRATAARNSTYSFLNLAVFPWFNFVNHEHHGVDISKYYENRPGEEKWGFNLTK